MPFGFGKKNEKPECKYDVKYVGGHKAYPKGKDTEALIFPDRLEIGGAMIIPYSSITDIENMEDHRITKTRAFLTPFFLGLFWKKNYLYTVIDYNDGRDSQSIVLDFHRSAEEAQQLIYECVLDSRTPSNLTHENPTYGIKMDGAYEGQHVPDNTRESHGEINKLPSESFPAPQNRDQVCRPKTNNLAKPITNISLLNIPVYDIKLVEGSFALTDMNLKKVELHPIEWDARIVLTDGKGKEGIGIPITDIIGYDLVAEIKGTFKKEKHLAEIIYKGSNGDDIEKIIRIKLEDKHIEEFLKSIEVLKENVSNSVYWTYHSLSFQTGTDQVATVDIYPLAPFLAEGEELIWHNSGIVKKKIVWLQAVTNYRVYCYDYVQHVGIVVLIPDLQDVVVMNQKRVSNSTSIGTYTMSRYNITGLRDNRIISLTIGDVQFVAGGRPSITFGQVGDPYGLARLVKSLKQQQAHMKIG